LDDFLALSGRRLAIKLDVEYHECQVLEGMLRTLRDNRCVVQVEAVDTRDQLIAMMTQAGYDLVRSLVPNYVFRRRGA
jgi:hypothetical protein